MNPQAQKIYSILQDSNFHCPSEWGYADGHCKRITDINKYLAPKGQKVVSAICNCGKHTSKVVARKIVPIAQDLVPERVKIWQAQFITKEKVKERGLW